MQNASVVGLPHFQIMGFSTKEEILDMPESNFDCKKETNSESDTNGEAQQKAKLSSSPVHVARLGKRRSLSKHSLLHHPHSLSSSSFFYQWRQRRIVIQENINPFSWSPKTQDTSLYQGMLPSLVSSLGAFVTFFPLFL